jgi:anti-sigma factor RsiW
LPGVIKHCRDMTENADAYLEGTLDWWNRGQLRLHLWMCDHCARYMKQLAATIAALKAMPAPDGPPLAEPVRTELMTSFRSMKAGAPAEDPESS